ncbi:hypothetical protein [Deinococcus sp. QL22]|uniref:hypothetical protein n=1 Tax=Deinococcus sp. QL22 TaxID=2939437 RepID=UPI00201783B1|nr:hypothetical protein [Deinococcus sp. QL22]UQN07153.1 hypothetical protein M1R55_04370 [Deinococcus sp. QL22]
MPDSARQTQLALIDSLARARRLAMSIVLPVVCLLSIVTIVLTNDGLSYHAYNTPIYSTIVVWFLLSWCGVRLYPGNELPYVSMPLACSFFLISKLTALIMFAEGSDFSLGLIEGMIWLYAVIVFALINSTLIFYW